MSDVSDDDYDASEDFDDASLGPVPSEVSSSELQAGDDGEREEEEEEQEAAELEIETDFNRLVGSIQRRESKSGSEPLGSGWDFSFQDDDVNFDLQDELRAATGIGRRKRGKPYQARTRDPEMSQQVRSMMIEANHAFVERNLEDAILKFQEIIRIDPRQSQPWRLLAECHRELGEPEKALQLEIVGAHLNHDPETWKDLGQRSRELGFMQQAVYCYRKVARLTPKSVDALWDRAILLKEIGSLRGAMHSYLAILKLLPHNLQVLNELRTIVVELSDLPQGISLYNSAFEHYRMVYPQGADSVDGTAGGFGDAQLLALADFYQATGEYEKAIKVIRSGTRWLQGRAHEIFWDLVPDDREYDLQNVVRSTENGSVPPGHLPMDVNLRHRLALSRLMLGETDEGKIHAHGILAHNVLEFSVLFQELADAFFDRDLFEDALGIYEQLALEESTSSIYVLLKVGACYRRLGNFEEAITVYERIIQVDMEHKDAKMQLAEIYEITNRLGKALELVYQVIDARNREPESQIPEGANPNQLANSLFEEKKVKSRTNKSTSSRMSAADLRKIEEEREADTQLRFKVIRELAARVDNGEEEAIKMWLIEVSAVTERFRNTRQLFPSNRYAHFKGMDHTSKKKLKSKRDVEQDENDMASRLEMELVRNASKVPAGKRVTVFRGIEFEEWLTLFIQYAFILTKRGQYLAADEILRHILVSNAYIDYIAQDAIRLALLTCAIHAGAQEHVVEHTRRLCMTHQFNNEPFRLIATCLSTGLRGTEAFIDSKLQKFLARAMRQYDCAISNPADTPETTKSKPEIKYNSRAGRWVFKEEGEGEEEEELPEGDQSEHSAPHIQKPTRPTKENPTIITLYGQTMLAAKSYQVACFYFLECARIQPNDPMIQLLLAISMNGRSMQRQVDNRHQLVVQGLAYLDQYRKLRRTGLGSNESSLVEQEIEYNVARWFHQLGLLAYADKHYRKVLEMAEVMQTLDPEEIGFAREAAYNLSLIYATSGSMGLVRDLYHRWLSV